MSQDIEKDDEQGLRNLHRLREELERQFENLEYEARHRFLFDPEFSLRVKTAVGVFRKKGVEVDPFTMATALHVTMKPIAGIP